MSNICIFAISVVLTGLPHANRNDNKIESSWVNKIVLNKTSGKILIIDEFTKKTREIDYLGWPQYKVVQEKGLQILIDNGIDRGLANKADFILSRDASVYFHRRLLVNPADTRSLFMRAVNWMEKNQLDLASDDIEACLTHSPKELSFHIVKSRILYLKSELDGAITEYNKSIDLSSNSSIAYIGLGIAWQRKGNLVKAKEYLDRALTLSPNCSFAFITRGSIWSSLGKAKEAIDDFSSALRVNPNAYEALVGKATELIELKEYNQAIKDLSLAIHNDPTQYIAYYNRGLAFQFNFLIEDAIENYSSAFLLKSDCIDALYNRGLAYKTLNKYNEALTDFDSILKIDRNHLKALFEKSGCYAKMGKKCISLEYLDEAFARGFKIDNFFEYTVDFDSIRFSRELQTILKKYSIK